MTFELMPADKNTRGLQFVNEVKGGHIPKEYIPSIEKRIPRGNGQPDHLQDFLSTALK